MLASMSMGRGFAFTTVGLAAGFSGLAVLAYVLTPASLLAAELVAAGVAAIALAFVARRAPRAVIVELWRVTRAGVLAGVAATFVYDVSRTALSVLDPSPYQPFEAIRQFGLGVLPAGAAPEAVLGVGFLIHVVNGSSFGVIYAMFAQGRVATRRAALVSGMAWGVALELIQSIIYPGWLGITSVLREFLLISAAGHLIYGATLGLGVRALLGTRATGGEGSA